MNNGHYIKGGDGSHWEGCEETHYDCKIAKLEEENAHWKTAYEKLFETNEKHVWEIERLHSILRRLQTPVFHTCEMDDDLKGWDEQ